MSSCDSDAIASAFGDKVFHPFGPAYLFVSQKEPNLQRSCRVTGGGILVLFNVLFTIHFFAIISALIFLPPFFLIGVIEFVVFNVIFCRPVVFKVYS
jgi:hypothetical protein